MSRFVAPFRWALLLGLVALPTGAARAGPFLSPATVGGPSASVSPMETPETPLLAQVGGSPGGSGALSTYGTSESRSGGGVPANWANPLISLIVQGLYADFSRTAPFTVPGFPLGPQATEGNDVLGFSIGETELSVYGNIDPYLYGTAILSFTTAQGAVVEEAFIQTTSLPFGFTFKGGRFHSSIGYMNVLHRHADDFVDTPLVYSAFLNGQLADDGAQLRWLAPTDVLLEFGTELLSGRTWPASGGADHGRGTNTQFVKLADDIGESASYLAGLSHVDSEAVDRLSGGDPASTHANGLSFTGSNTLNLFSIVYKWSPLGNLRYTAFKLQYEYFEGDEHGVYTVLDGSGSPTMATIDLRGGQGVRRTGWYAQATYKFHERWRIGVRQSEVTAELPRDSRALGTELDPLGHAPAMTSAMAEFLPSDFSQFRVQYSYDQTVPNRPADRWVLQYIASLGSHGAHSY